jgi:hypothetical protein
MSRFTDADIFSLGREALALAREAFAGRGLYSAVRRQQPDGAWLGPPTAVDLATLDLARIAFTFGEPEEARRERLAALSVGDRPILPVPVGEPQGLDTLGFFAACRQAHPAAHLVADLETLGHKLAQLCLSFGADEIVGSIVAQRELRLGARVGSKDLTREEAARMLTAAGFDPCERLPEGEAGSSCAGR